MSLFKKERQITPGVVKTLQALSDEINNRYRFVADAGDNFREPVINSGPCGPFANEFYKAWNSRFKNRVKTDANHRAVVRNSYLHY